MAAVTLLEARNLTRHFAGITAVDEVSFSLPEGDIRALIGPNGAGKTTLVSLICGRIPASSGQTIFDGEDISTLPAHNRIMRGMAYTFQITSIFKDLSVEENVAIAVQRKLKYRDQRFREVVQETLERVGLADRARTTAGTLAYGHQRLLEIAMGLGQSPRLLILDEPTQGLATSEVTAFNDLIREVAASTTILLIEHNMDVVMELAKSITVLDMGRVIAEGTPDEIRTNAAVQAAYLGGDNA